MSWIPRAILVGALLAAPASAPPTRACSTFSLVDGDHVLFGKNYDWSFGDGLLLVNPRGMLRVADVGAGTTPARWSARFGSVTFNQYGRDFPSGGINEAGLVVELMWLEDTRYPDPDERPGVGGLQWIQYQLDRSRTVAEVIASDAEIRIAGGAPLHYLVADASGDAASIEFLDGRLVAHRGEELPVAALTNSRYDASLRRVRSGEGRSADRSSLSRFAILAERLDALEEKDSPDPVAYAFESLVSVAQAGATQWSIVYEQKQRRVHFRTLRHREVRTLALEGLDFSCAAGARVLDLMRPLAGDVGAALEPYSREVNRLTVRTAYAKTSFLSGVPEAEIDRVARYPEQAACESR